MTQRQMFVVSEVGSEYNDQINVMHYDDAGHPKMIYETNAEAEAAVRHLIIAFITEPGFSLRDYTDYADQDEIDEFEYADLEGKIEVLNRLGLNFYRIDAVNVYHYEQ